MGKNLSSLKELYLHKARTKLDKGTNKYIIIELKKGSESIFFVRSKRYADYHIEIFERFKKKLQRFSIKGVDLLTITRLECTGGGRIEFDGKNAFIYGYSQSYG